MFAALCARLGRPPKALFTAACGLLEGVLRYMSQHHLLDSNIHLASFDDHYLYDSLSLRIDTVQQDNRQLASALLRSAQPADRRSGPGAASALPARHPADSPSLTARLAISVFRPARAACLSASSALASTRQGRSLPASGKPPATRAIHHPAPASPDSSPPAPRCRSAPGLTSFDAGRMAEWSGSGCRTAGAASLAGTAPALGPARWPAARAMPPADARRHSPAAADNAAPRARGLESGAHRRQRPVASRCGAGMFIRRSRRSATHCASSSSWRICLSRKTSLAGKFMPRPSAGDRQPREQRDDKAPFSR